MTQSVLGHGYCITGDYAKAEPVLREGIAAAADRGNVDLLANMTWNLGMVLLERGEVAESTDLAVRSLRTARELGHPPRTFDALQLLASIATAQGDHTRAARLFGAADDLVADVAAMSRSEWERAISSRDRDRARQALGEQDYDDAYQCGARLETEEAITLAIGGQVPATEAGKPLTRRQAEIADLVAEGLTNRQIANRLVISVRTAETHVDHVLTRLGFANRSQLAAWVAGRNAASEAEPPS